MRRLGAGVLALAIGLAACAQSAASPSAPPVELTIFGAASLRDALMEVKVAYESANPGTRLSISTDSSAALATKIEQGAPADVFLSADAANPGRLASGGFTVGDPVVFAGNELVIVVPVSIPGNIQSPLGLLAPGVRIIAAGDDVPITRYADQVLDNLASLPGYPADYAARYEANVVSREDNVKAVVARIELGEGDAAIVYTSDALASSGVAHVALPPAANVRAAYAGVVVRASRYQAAAAAFLDWLTFPDGYLILARHGFLPPA